MSAVDERIVKDIMPNGDVIIGSARETAAFRERTKTIFRAVVDCHHCDAPFPKSYLRWHAARALKRPDRMAMLTCKKCGCWTPVQFDEGLEAQPA
jgi:hypothetical protein